MKKGEKEAILEQVKQCINKGNGEEQCLTAVGNTFDLEEDERETISELLKKEE